MDAQRDRRAALNQHCPPKRAESRSDELASDERGTAHQRREGVHRPHGATGMVAPPDGSRMAFTSWAGGSPRVGYSPERLKARHFGLGSCPSPPVSATFRHYSANVNWSEFPYPVRQRRTDSANSATFQAGRIYFARILFPYSLQSLPLAEVAEWRSASPNSFALSYTRRIPRWRNGGGRWRKVAERWRRVARLAKGASALAI